jgi:PPOX class probable F420-dependent enzyme
MAGMTVEQVRSFLRAGTRTAKLATVRGDGRPHVVPVWFVLDGEAVVFTTGAESVKGRSLRRDPRVALCVDEEEPPFAFVALTGVASLSTDLDDLLRFATLIGGRYMGADRAEEFGRRNGVPGELLVRVKPLTVVAEADIAA